MFVAGSLRRLLYLAALLLCASSCLTAEQIPVRYVEGTLRGFIAVQDDAGKLMAEGDLIQTVHGDRVTEHVVFHFKDGSLDDETTVFTERKTFRLVSDHHIQRGPFFPHPTDTNIDMHSGQVTVRTTNKDGKEEVDSEHMKLPPDLANGMTSILSRNLSPHATKTEVGMIVTTPKPRLVKLVFTPSGEDGPFSVAGSSRKSVRYDVKIDLGGVAGVIAPLIGKQPPDIQMWVVPGEAPLSIKEKTILYSGGPVLTFEMTSPTWPPSPDGRIVK